jgi:hypothetical protein
MKRKFKQQRYTSEDKDFNKVLDYLEKKYKWSPGEEESEVIVNWNKMEVKEDGLVSFYSGNSTLSSAIKRCRSGIRVVELMQGAATLYFDAKAVRPLHFVLKKIS